MTWKKVNEGEGGGDNFMKWESVGQTLEGVWEGLSEGKFGDLGCINGVKFPMHTVLDKALNEVEDGVKVKVVYMGMKTSKKGNRYKDFDVFVDE